MSAPLLQSTDAACAVQVDACVFFRIGLIWHMEYVSEIFCNGCIRLATVTLVQRQMLLNFLRVRTFHKHSQKGCLQQLPIWRIRSTYHQPQGQALLIDQQTAFCASFSPIRRGFPRLFATQWGFWICMQAESRSNGSPFLEHIRLFPARADAQAASNLM